MSPLTSKLISTTDEFLMLQSEWNVLLESIQSPSIFLTWEWIITWLETVHPEADLFIVIVRDEHDRLVAVAPFYITNFTLFSCISYKTLRFLGDCQSGAEYPDVIIRHEYEDIALALISTEIANNKNKWDCAWFPNVASWTGSLERLSGCFKQSELVFNRINPKNFSSIVLPSSWNEFIGKFSAKKRSLYSRQERKASQNGRLQIKFLVELKSVNDFLEQLFHLHKQRWNAVGQSGAFIRQPRMKKFYRKMAMVALKKGWVATFVLFLDGEVKAIQYGYIYNQIFNQLQEGFDPNGPSGLGNILRLYVIKWCIEKGIKEYDFLGGYSLHKEQWKAEKRIGYDFFVGRKCLKNFIFTVLPISPSGRYVNQGIPSVPRQIKTFTR